LNDAGLAFGHQRLQEYVLNTAELGPARQGTALREAWARWRGGARQTDDVFFLAFAL
jgi:hypothetical protein